MSAHLKTPLSADEVREMLATCFSADAAELSDDRTRESLPGWDSMGALLLIAELDERFGLELPAETSRQMTRVSHVFDFLRQHGLVHG